MFSRTLGGNRSVDFLHYKPGTYPKGTSDYPITGWSYTGRSRNPPPNWIPLREEALLTEDLALCNNTVSRRANGTVDVGKTNALRRKLALDDERGLPTIVGEESPLFRVVGEREGLLTIRYSSEMPADFRALAEEETVPRWVAARYARSLGVNAGAVMEMVEKGEVRAYGSEVALDDLRIALRERKADERTVPKIAARAEPIAVPESVPVQQPVFVFVLPARIAAVRPRREVVSYYGGGEMSD